MSDPLECFEYKDFRSDRTVCSHGRVTRSCTSCESEVLDRMVHRQHAEIERLASEIMTAYDLLTEAISEKKSYDFFARAAAFIEKHTER